MMRSNPVRAARLLLGLGALLLCASSLSVSAAEEPVERAPISSTIAMIGAGNMGQALGNLWAAAGYHVIFATRHPEELDAVVERAGHGAEAASVAEAIEQAGIIALAVPYGAEPGIAKAHGAAMRGKVLVDVNNAFERRDGEVAKKAEAVGEAVYSARLFEGTRFVRAFNLKGASSFPTPQDVESADYEVPYTVNDESVRHIAEALIHDAGGTPVYEGGLENAREY
ncbi:NAD(P)-binding domain-containing protein [Endozoicomonas sp. G2_2]|uniref:NADPH-dependent F420 reductase n=1 Tax=Endozoicomonas sp. G2_2 TaxID=2821092 RepID=UPI001AD9C55D|nr:NAD(P)-binding domain-containing protein [Endozoicomonas sp. G2_2]MBO9470585.1 NAD(P)-binding domain-containing protein [Endozoicomonas sp. G2_2]